MRQHEEVRGQIQHGQNEGQRHKTDVLRGSEEEDRGEQSRGDRGVVWISQPTRKLIDERKEINTKLDSTKSERMQNRIR